MIVKKQILMRYLGLGWEEAHNSWSKDGVAFAATKLLEYFCKVVISLDNTIFTLDDPPLKLLSVPM